MCYALVVVTECGAPLLAADTRKFIMHASRGAVHINKIAAASRQLDTAIRMFFAREDELAIHTIASAAFRILRDVTKKRGKNFTAEVLRNGFYGMARQYAEGKLPKDMLKLIENTPVMALIKSILEGERAQGGKLDLTYISIGTNNTHERRAWPSNAANFLKHADRDPEEHLALDELKNENVLIGACAAYLELMKMPTPEIIAFCASARVARPSSPLAHIALAPPPRIPTSAGLIIPIPAIWLQGWWG
jgi:hypothetical protein